MIDRTLKPELVNDVPARPLAGVTAICDVIPVEAARLTISRYMPKKKKRTAKKTARKRRPAAAPPSLRIDALHIENFRGFKAERFRFRDRFNVIIGDNATGKTAILDALSVAIGGFLLGAASSEARPIRRHGVRLRTFRHGGTTSLEPLVPTS